MWAARMPAGPAPAAVGTVRTRVSVAGSPACSSFRGRQGPSGATGWGRREGFRPMTSLPGPPAAKVCVCGGGVDDAIDSANALRV